MSTSLMTSMTNAPSSPRAAWQDDAVLWQHGAFCRLALPLSTPKDSLWSREAEGISIAMGTASAAEAGEGLPLPGGSALRLLLLHVFTAALQSGSAAVGVGNDAASLASSLGLAATPRRLKELAEQSECLVKARLRVSEGKGAELSVLDARRRSGSRSGPSGWRLVLHLTERFFASLQQDAVALDRGVVAALAGSALALDAYAWLTATLPEASADRPVLATWPELQERFGEGGTSNAVAFRRAFSRSLAAVGAACPMLRFKVGRAGVELRGAVVSLAASAPEPAPQKLPAPEPDTTPPEVLPLPATAPILMDRDVPKRDAAPATAPAVPTAMAADVAVAEPGQRSRPNVVQGSMRHATAEAKPHPERKRNQGRIRLAPGLTGLEQSVWLRRGEDPSNAMFEVTSGGDYNPARRSLLILEPMILQVQGFLQPRELEQVAAWATANAGLIQDYWDGSVVSASVIAGRVKSVTISRW